MSSRFAPARRTAAVLLSAGLLALALFAPALAGAIGATPVLSGEVDEHLPGANADHLAWSANSRRNPDHFDTYLDPPVGSKVKVNPAGTSGWSGGMDDDTFVHQVVKKGNSDVRMLNLTTMDPFALPSGDVNTRAWEWGPDIEGDWLLFGRSTPAGRRLVSKVILYNLDTDERRTIASDSAKGVLVYPGEIAGTYLTWEDCVGEECDVYRYDIGSATSTTIAPPGSDEWSSAVMDDGTVFYGQEDDLNWCTSTQLIRQPLVGSPVVLDTIPSGFDTNWAASRVNTDTSVDWLFDRYKCSGKYPVDIYEIAGADTAPAEAAPAIADSGATPAGPSVRPAPLGSLAG